MDKYSLTWPFLSEIVEVVFTVLGDHSSVDFICFSRLAFRLARKIHLHKARLKADLYPRFTTATKMNTDLSIPIGNL